MPAVCRETDELATGHGCDGTTTLDTPTQSTVFATGQLVARQGDATVVHLIGGNDCDPHVANVNVGSGTVFCEGAAVARIGDSADADAMTTGSATVFAG